MPPKPLKVFLTPHWHVDHAWVKSHEQYMRELVVPNFRVLLKILKRNPHYKCSVEQATQWMSLKRLDPQTYNELMPYVQKGNIALVGGQVLSPDINIPNGESLIRNYFYGRRFLQKEFNKDTDIAWNIDLFGHIFQYPLILRHVGMNFYVFHRGVNDKKFRKDLMNGKPASPPNVLFKWVDLNGKNPIICYYQTNTYSSFSFSPVEVFNATYFFDVFAHKTVFQKAIMSVIFLVIKAWKLGNRLPTRSMIKVGTAGLSNLINYRPFLSLPEPRMLFTTIGSDFTAPSGYLLHYWNYLKKIGQKQGSKFLLATPQEFFKDTMKKSNLFGSITSEFHEIGRIFSGVWSSRIRLKQNNRKCEQILYDLEALATMNNLIQSINNFSSEYPLQEIDDLWEICLINQFHDIACGCGIDLVYLQAMSDYEKFFTGANHLIEKIKYDLVEFLSGRQNIDQLKSANAVKSFNYYVIINTLPWKRDIVFQNKIINDIPGLGYKIIEFEHQKIEDNVKSNSTYPIHIESNSELTIEGFKFCFKNNKLIEIFDTHLNATILKSNGTNYIGAIRMIQEKGDAYDTVPVRILEIMKIRSMILKSDTETEAVIELIGELDTGNAVIVETWTIKKMSHEIHIYIDLTNDIDKIKLEFCIPHASDLSNALASIQYGVKKNPKGIFPVQNWISFQNHDHGILIVNRGTPEHIYFRPNCYVTLIRGFDHIAHVSIKIPRKTPLGLEKGNYTFDFTIKPFKQQDLEKIKLENIAMEILHPCIEQVILKSMDLSSINREFGLIEIPKHQISISTIKFAHFPIKKEFSQVAEQSKAVILRVYNPTEKSQSDVEIKVIKGIKTMKEIDGNESPVGSEAILPANGVFKLNLDGFDLKTLKFQ